MTIQERLKCVTPALATPLKKDGTFDPEGMTKLVKYVMSKGMTNIFVLGYAGEVLAFSREERKAIIKTAREAAGPDALLIAGVMDDSTRLILQHMEDAKESGADVALTTPTDFVHCTESELESCFLRLADEAALPFIIYNCPENQHYIEPELMNKLLKKDKIVGFKETSNAAKIQQMLLNLDKDTDFIMMSGEEFVYYPAMALGVDAFIMGGPGNILPAQSIEIWEDYKAGKHLEARDKYMNMIAFLSELYFGLPYPTMMPQIKAVLELWGICGRWMTHPTAAVSDEHMEVIRKLLDKYQITP